MNRRYNNDHLLFIRQIEIFLNQPSIQKQTSSEIKKLHDTTVECIHAIHNLNIDTNTWDPILVHILTKKLDPMTLSDYEESHKSPRDLASLDEFITFLKHKFTALEPLGKKERESMPATSEQREVGYLTDTLFDILDDRFAEKYQKDIETIQKREDHLFNLYKNQTSIMKIITTSFNETSILLIKQLESLGKTLHNISADIDLTRTSLRALHAMSMVSSMMAADVTISNLR